MGVATLWSDLRKLLPLEEVLRRGAGILLIVVIAWLAYWLLRRALMGAMRAVSGRVEDKGHRQRITTLVLLLASIAKYVIVFVAAVVILSEQLGVKTAPILAAAGVVGLAVGFGAQNLVRDVVAGFFIIMEGQYGVGDLVEINGAFGRVEEVGLRITKLRDPSGQVRYFPNGSITTAKNYIAGYILYVLTVPLSDEGETDAAGVVGRALDAFEREFAVLAEPPPPGRIESLPEYVRVLRVEIKCLPGRQSLLEQKLPARLSAALARAGRPLPEGTEIGLALRGLPSEAPA